MEPDHDALAAKSEPKLRGGASLTLPDVSSAEAPVHPGMLAWVGMQGIDLPVEIVEHTYRRTTHAHADVHVDLPAPHVKGIHMSRLYRLLDRAMEQERAATPGALRDLLRAMVESHADCASTSARLRLSFSLLVRRPALVTEGLAGWSAYPVRLDASLVDGVYKLNARVTVTYSSTCPCSAALSRQLVAEAFQTAFAGQPNLKPSNAAEWLRQHASLATPHSQRSDAVVDVDVDEEASDLGLLSLINAVEAALGTPVQTAVKRADEQAFARLNGENLMFVEDAARRIQRALGSGLRNVRVHVRHRESLHPHDAVAWAL